MSQFFAPIPYQPQPVFVRVVGWEGERNDALEQRLTELLEQHALSITGLVTGLEHAPDLTTTRALQTSAGLPTFTFPEFKNRQVQKVLTDWMVNHPKLSANLLFIETSDEYATVQYAWLFNGLRPMHTGSNEAVRHRTLNEHSDWPDLTDTVSFTYEIQFRTVDELNSLGFVSNFLRTMELAQKELNKINATTESRQTFLEFNRVMDEKLSLRRWAESRGMPSHSSLLATSSPDAQYSDVAGERRNSPARQPRNGDNPNKRERRSSDKR